MNNGHDAKSNQDVTAGKDKLLQLVLRVMYSNELRPYFNAKKADGAGAVTKAFEAAYKRLSDD